jgi:hypothetical protein
MAATTTKTATPKAANGTVKKAAGRPKGVGKKNNAKNAMAKMQAYCKLTLTRFVAFFGRVRRNVALRPRYYEKTASLTTDSQSSPRRVQGPVLQGAAARTWQEGLLASAVDFASRMASR